MQQQKQQYMNSHMAGMGQQQQQSQFQNILQNFNPASAAAAAAAVLLSSQQQMMPGGYGNQHQMQNHANDYYNMKLQQTPMNMPVPGRLMNESDFWVSWF